MPPNLFTVLMCCNRDDGYLFPAIDSVLRQSFQSFEFVIVLNNCSDELYAAVAAIGDPRIVLKRTRIGQLSFNLNFGIDLASGRYIVRFDADDICHPDRLRRTSELIAQHPDASLIAGSCRLIDESGKVIGMVDATRHKDWRSALNRGNPFVHPALAIRKDVVIRARGYLGGFHSEDYDLWLRLSDNPEVSVVTDSFPMIDYRISASQARGSLLGYAEVASYFLRRMILAPKFSTLFALVSAIAKAIVKGRR